ncbi:e9imm peptide [Streptomyces sp. DK15]|uniref:e9imm peptide n=1 Tax=Streptomyces sp. DK15 TaxID=2957499 RepID=UPI0029BAD779|nr:e9imm peptide [Streptomyces sp. DK15]MDX2393424.1 e9imm peptide [Streptomyces sp. DK15]
MTRDESVALVAQLLDGSIIDEAEADAALATLKVELSCPHISDYIYWDFDPEVSAEKVVNRAMSYAPFEL